MLKRFAGNSFFFAMGSILTRGIAFFLIPLYTVHLTPSDYGIIGICTAITSILSMTVTLGLSGAISIYYFKLSAEEFRDLLRTVWVWYLLTPLLLTLLIEPFGEMATSSLFVSVGWNPYIRLAVWISFFSVALEIPLALFYAEQRARMHALVTVSSFLITTSLILYFVVVRQEGALGSLRAQFLAGLIIAIASHLFVWKRATPWQWPGVKWKHLWAALKLNVPALPYIYCLWALNVSDRWILERYVSMADIGIYNLAYTIGMVVSTLGLALGAAYSPQYYKNAKNPEFTPELKRLLSVYLFLITWITLSVALLSRELILSMTSLPYHGAIELVPWIAVGYWAYAGFYLQSLGVIQNEIRTQWIIVLTGPAALINIGLNLYFVPRIGVHAAAFNTLVAFFIMALSGFIVARRMDKLPYQWSNIFQMLLAALLCFAVGSLWLSSPNLLLAFLAKTLLLGITGLFMLKFSGFNLMEIVQATRKVLKSLNLRTETVS
jgi:O-antigen/teichoic acid export membrane protein